jgi:hypothetical protein
MNVYKGRKKVIYTFSTSILLLVLASGCQTTTYVKTSPVSGKVIDAETNAPIDDVIVIGYWPASIDFSPDSSEVTVELLEVITDKEGNYYMPGWVKTASYGTFTHSDPRMIFYKTGYEIETLHNEFSFDTYANRPSYFRPWSAGWDGKEIKLKRFKGDNRAYRKYLNSKHYSTDFRPIFNDCKYMNVPRLLIAMEKYYQSQPDYWVPGRTFTLSDAQVTESFRSTEKSQKNSVANQSSSMEITNPENKPLPSILTITQLENIGSRCEVTPIEYLKRITNNEKDFIRSSNHDISTNN